MSADSLIISALEAGTQLCGGRYLVLEKLADGAVASVYKARDTQLSADVALKILDPLRGADPVGHARFEREFQVLSSLDHPAISRCHRLERDGDLDILVLELVTGPTLEEVIARGRSRVHDVVTIGVQLADALEACHARGILHRDLKPSNIILHPTRGAVILDFGVAWFSSAANLTRTGAVIGSPQYLAPEAFSTSHVDARADLYALGVILFEMVTGRPVYLVTNVAELAITHMQAVPPSAGSLRAGVPTALDAAISRAIATRAEDRFATAGEFRDALRSGQLPMVGALQARLPCHRCRTPLVLDLPFCPGCGGGVAWRLEPGPYAVQISEVKEPDKVMAWLLARHRDALAGSRASLSVRLHHTPFPLVVGASLETAEQLAAEARQQGCSTEILRARGVVGAALKTSAARPGETMVAMGLHFAAVTASTLLIAALAPSAVMAAVTMPAVMGVGGALVARWYVRRPMVRVGGASKERAGRAAEDQLRTMLGTLRTERARRMAAGAVSRAAPALLEERSTARLNVISALKDALERVVAMDAHADFLAAHPRSRLAAQYAEAQALAERNDPDGVRRLAELQVARQELTEASVAHDQEARRALEATLDISRAVIAG